MVNGIKPSKKNTQAFLTKVRERIRASGDATQEELIFRLNPIIRGWANYHRHIAAKRTYCQVDHDIWKALWKWARKRHARWVAGKYWHLSERRGWNFAADTGKSTESGKPIRLHLIRTVCIAIRRHPRLENDVNPFDPAWREYLEQRALLKRFGPEFVEQCGFLLGHKKRKPVVKTGSASVEL